MNIRCFILLLAAALVAGGVARGQVPQLLNYQGRVIVGSTNFQGTGQFKFALVNGTGTTTYWSNDGTSAGGSEPTAAVTLTVTNGLYSVLLGDSSLPNMAVIPPGVFQNPDVRLRVWFNDAVHGSQLLTPDQRIAAVGYAMVAGNVPDGAITGAKIATGAVGSQQLAAGAVTSNAVAAGAITGSQLAPGAAASNLNAGGLSGVGSGGVVLSTDSDNTALTKAGYVKLNLTVNSPEDYWDQKPSGPAPTPRYNHTAVWTGSEMIVWGGSYNSQLFTFSRGDGARYDPATDVWTPLNNTIYTPSPRGGHVAVWTGADMLIWGGSHLGTYYNDGARYNAASDSWETLPVGPLAARDGASAVAAKGGILIWGGGNGSTVFNDGAILTGFTWSAMPASGAPAGRRQHSAVATNSSLMIVWGGQDANGTALATGGRYNFLNNKWLGATTLTGAPPARTDHTAVWTGTQMLVWGGDNGGHNATSCLSDGGRYQPVTDTWATLSPTNAPDARSQHTAVWSDSEMIIWGGSTATGGRPAAGGRYNPATNTWTSMNIAGAPSPRFAHSAVWTGKEMLIWGGYGTGGAFATGARYNSATDTWKPILGPGGASPRRDHVAVWTGSEMLIWGGLIGNGGLGSLATGSRFDPVTNTWAAIPTSGAPSARNNATAVWTGSEMIVWGGYAPSANAPVNDGGRFNPASNSWTTMSTAGAPAGRTNHTAVWTGSYMIVWGGLAGQTYFGDGARYEPQSNTWIAINSSSSNAPEPRFGHTAVWTGSEMIVWGGTNGLEFADGARYSVMYDSWQHISPTLTITARRDHTAVWTGFEMLVWGGWGGYDEKYLDTGARYSPATDQWSPITKGPPARSGHTAVWTGREMIIWGGGLRDGARYDPVRNSWASVGTVGAPPFVNNQTAVWTGTEMLLFGQDFAKGGDTPLLFGYTPPPVVYLYMKP